MQVFMFLFYFSHPINVGVLLTGQHSPRPAPPHSVHRPRHVNPPLLFEVPHCDVRGDQSARAPCARAVEKINSFRRRTKWARAKYRQFQNVIVFDPRQFWHAVWNYGMIQVGKKFQVGRKIQVEKKSDWKNNLGWKKNWPKIKVEKNNSVWKRKFTQNWDWSWLINIIQRVYYYLIICNARLWIDNYIRNRTKNYKFF